MKLIGFRDFRLPCAVLVSVLTVYANSNNEVINGDGNASLGGTSEIPSEGMEFFHGTFKEALAHAGQEDKLVFVDVYTIWCGPCVVMQESVFPLPEVGEFFNARFINYKLDAESEEQNGPELAARFDIQAYPTYLILDPDGNELNRSSSALPSDQFISMVGRMLGESHSKFDEMQARYDSGERSAKFIQQYLLDATVELSFRELDNQDMDSVTAYYEEGEKYKAIANEYFAGRPLSESINEFDIQLVMYFYSRNPRGDEMVEFVIDNYDEVLAVSSDAAMSQFVLEATLTSVAEAAQAGDEKFLDYIEALDSHPLNKAVEYERTRDPQSRFLPGSLKYSWETQYLLARKDFERLDEVYKDRLEKRGDAATANHYWSAARKLVQSEQLAHREVALDYAERAVELDPDDPWAVATLASSLVAVEKNEVAQKLADEYRSKLTESKIDQDNLRIFNILTPAELREKSEESSLEE
ncbi:MAG: thioredoxin family protein [Gammaproteobacteria bacterium]|nr:thioredoxin family protein [Gammaproteobacteria bacterium]